MKYQFDLIFLSSVAFSFVGAFYCFLAIAMREFAFKTNYSLHDGDPIEKRWDPVVLLTNPFINEIDKLQFVFPLVSFTEWEWLEVDIVLLHYGEAFSKTKTTL